MDVAEHESRDGGRPEDVNERSKQLLDAATKAAARGDVEATVKALYESFFLDGLVAQLHREWPQLEREDVEDAVADAVGDAASKLGRGETIRTLPGFLRIAAARNADDRHGRRVRERRADDQELTDLIDARADELASPDGDEVRLHPIHDLHPDEQRRLALRLARALTQQIQTDAERNVVTLLLDAIENGTAAELEAADIGSALGLRTDYVRKAKERGLGKLKRLAHAAGYCDHDLDLNALLSASDS